MKINLAIEPPSKKGNFSTLKVGMGNREDSLDSMRLDFSRLYEFAEDKSSPAFDFLIIAIFVYSIDKLVKRELHSVDGWSREFEVCFPVLEVNNWDTIKEQFSDCLSFLTGDYWTISFEKREADLYPQKKARRKKNIAHYHRNDYRAVSLFSGGLDSLVGVIDNLEENKPESSKLLLASHFDGGGAKSDQERLFDALRAVFGNEFSYVSCGAGITDNPNSAREPSSRSRSIIFIGIGLYLAHSISNTTPLLIPENGTISLNFPLSPSRRSSCSTRTTHPYFLESLQKALGGIGIHNPFINPYQLKTKGELVSECRNLPLLKKTALLSASCGKRGHTRSWDSRGGGVHNCGKCMPCIYRRAALYKIGLDNEVYGVDIFTSHNFHLDSNQVSAKDFSACLSFLRKNQSRKEIGIQLLNNGRLNLSKLENYIDVVVRTRQELKNWIASSNNSTYKIKAGIK